MGEERTFDPIWRDIYARGHTNRYPWDSVVRFVFRHAPETPYRGDVRILEVGCGTGSNLWFCAREGFSTTGVDASDKAIEVARQRFDEEGLVSDFRVADFTHLPFENAMFDLVIDRAAITTTGCGAGKRAIREVQRVLKTEGLFFFNPYASGHSSQSSGKPGPDGVVIDIASGTLTGAVRSASTLKKTSDRSFPLGGRYIPSYTCSGRTGPRAKTLSTVSGTSSRKSSDQVPGT